ncbi:unnamed protein product [Brassicogethes aeneus]|uniref:PH domain-containing protein n=1 Tax=Brassicogethes aeneus TaxID=1431903 RepID=A0A9P0BBH3_BRAAE|nr:unnamed protein product [Brassicogethes aeneus]
MAEQNLTQTPFENPMFREIHKNTWLKRISPANSKKKKEKFWVVFCVHDDTNAFLETYVDNKLADFHKPDWFVSLNDVQHISPTICATEQEYEFVLTLTNQVIRLAAPTWDQMLDWVEALKNKLHELRILSPKENLYTKLPDRCVPLLPTRDPTSPLPPTPAVPPEIIPGVEIVNSISQTRSRIQLSESQEESSVFQFQNLNAVLDEPAPSSAPSNWPSGHYEFLFQQELQQTPGPSNREHLDNLDVRNNSIRVLERSTSCSPRILQAPPQPYKTLREQQVLQLQKEIKHPAGVRLQLRRKDCISSIGFVDAFDAVWICGWKQKEHPMLYSALHIGDRLVSIEGILIRSASEAHRILQSPVTSHLYVNIIVKRIPYGQVLVIHRESEGQNLGIVQENNTAVIETVESDSLAARAGLTCKAKTCDGTSFTNWVLTEINGRPLNLFFKKNQVRDRLNAVGRDISILVQPHDLVKQLKKQMKCLKNYKDYILQ